MNKYIGADGLSYLWDKVKNHVSEEIQGKLDYKGVLSSSNINTVKASDYKVGQCWKTYSLTSFAGGACEMGDFVLCIANKNGGYSDSDFMVIQANLDIKTYTNAEIDLLTSDTETRQVELSIIPATGSADAEGYEFGEGAAVWIKITNTGNEPLNGTLECEQTGGEWTITNLKPLESEIFCNPENTYIVSEDDILAGSFYFEATFTGSGTSSGVTATSAKQWMSAAPPNGHLTVHGTCVTEIPEEGFAIGDAVEWQIYVANDGNLTIESIEIICELTVDKWDIDSLAPGESSEYFTTSTHYVTEDDVLSGRIPILVTAEGVSPDPDVPDVPVEPYENTVPTVEP